ncbi:hypothetical protein PoB_005916400 [Plakobranchus ocellatus]|uniref:Uncharacterized protein n=1 Tax=Plakobranchus ocellatus TaxID=259542 RepID=A0AAV4CIP3_9GAST|nr:hypothetical protein PoB_005916400 [Plakobranchus ocellatus]
MERLALVEKYGEANLNELTNGVILDIYKDTNKVLISTTTKLVIWTDQSDNIMLPPLNTKISRIVQKASKLRGKALAKFKEEKFMFPSQTSAPYNPEPIPSIPGPSTSHNNNNPSPPPSLPSDVLIRRSTPQRNLNIAHHEIEKNKRRMEMLQRKLTTLRNQLNEQGKRNSHYNIKNVKKREERSLAMRQMLRKESSKQTKMTKDLEAENLRLKQKLAEMVNDNRKLKRKVSGQQRRIVELMAAKKKIVQKDRKSKNSLKKSDEHLVDQNLFIEDGTGDGGKKVLETKKDGEFTENMRLCVLELAGLEVATSKVAPVIETVGKLCGITFSHLPQRTACQSMIDEGHVLAKSYIKDTILNRCRSFGLHKDGTTRKKIKILDTSIQTDTGSSFCLGWSSVASETGQAIADEAKEKLEELAEPSDVESMKGMLEKLVYFMNDRAANEKKSSRLLEEWKDNYLKEHGVEDIKKIHHLYCAAHVLLGFHSYVIQEVKQIRGFETTELKHPITCLLRDASDIFGPVGDYRGVRNLWEGYCSKKEIKSEIKNYKDNRFNGLFEVSAQVFHHHQDFLTILTSMKTKNMKQARLFKALQNEQLILLTECLALIFHKITGPFWSFVISKKASYQTLQQTVQGLFHSLQKCVDNPSHLFDEQNFSFLNYPTSSPETKSTLSKFLKPEMSEILSKISNGLLKTVKIQLADFLEGGMYFKMDSTKDVTAPLTNLVCERHFGHLDASQRRRPNSSLHHHSSVMLLKQTRGKLRDWLSKLPAGKRSNLWRRARVEGNKHRKRHREQDRKTIMDAIHALKLCNKEPDLGDVQQGELLAVACEDAWYPAVVKEASSVGQDILVSFAKLGKGLGVFYWPDDKDVHPVSRRSILNNNLDVQPRAGGRLWFVENALAIQQKFKTI